MQIDLINDAHTNGSSAQAYARARRLAGTQKGASRKWGRMPLTSRASIDQLKDKFGMDGDMGGCSAVESEYDMLKEEIIQQE